MQPPQLPLQPTLSDIPHPFGAIERSRLLDRLNQKWRQHVVLISGPAGYGKTTLAAQFAASVDMPVAWYTVRPLDRDVAALHDRVAQALSHLMQIEACHISEELPASESAIRLAKSLQKVNEPILIVLDDIHQLDGLEHSQNWLRSFIDYLPKRCRVMLVSRTVPDLSFIHLLAHGDVWALGQADLRFDGDELNRLKERQPLTQNDPDQAALLARLDGWPAGSRLALEPLPPEFLRSILGSAQSAPEALFEQLAMQMLRQLPDDLQDFLQASSTLEQFTAHRCTEILGLTGSTSLLNRAVRQNVFLYQTQQEFSFHPLFRDLLQRTLQTVAPDTFADFHRRAAEWFEAREEFGLAFSHYVIGGETANASRLAENTAILMYGQGRFETLLEWRQILREARHHTPHLAFTCSSVYLDRFDYDRALAEVAFAENEPRAIIRRAFIIQQRGHYQHALELLDSIPVSSIENRRLYAVALRVSGLAHLALGNPDLAISHLEQSVALHRQYGDVSNLSRVLQDLQMAYTRVTRLDEAGACLQEIVALRQTLGGAEGIALALHNVGDHYHQQSRYEAALEALEDGLSAISEIRSRRVEGVLKWTLGSVKRDLGLFQTAQTYYQQARTLCPKDSDPQIQVGILLHSAYLNRWQGRLDEAVRLTEDALWLAEQHQLKLETLLAKAHRWAVMRLKNHRQEDEQEDIASIIESLKQLLAFFPLLRILAFSAEAKLTLGDSDVALSFIRQAVQIADTIGTAQPIAAEMLHSPRLFDLITSHLSLYSPLLDQNYQALRTLAQISEDPEITPPDREPTQSLRIVILGQEKISRNGEEISIARWRGAQSRELFFHLLFEGPQSRQGIALELWPDSNEVQARENFNSTLYQARRAVARDTILLEDGRYQINPAIEIWCDAYEVEKAAKSAKLLAISDPYATQQLEKIVSLYQGEFLSGIEADWAIPIRERIDQHYFYALKRLGQATQPHDPQKAMRYWKRAIQLDPLDEEVNMLVIQCYAFDLGQKHLAIAHYQRYQQRLQDELKAKPDKALVELMSQLMG